MAEVAVKEVSWRGSRERYIKETMGGACAGQGNNTAEKADRCRADFSGNVYREAVGSANKTSGSLFMPSCWQCQQNQQVAFYAVTVGSANNTGWFLLVPTTPGGFFLCHPVGSANKTSRSLLRHPVGSAN
nr:hypothetical protein [Klebsiella variicola]